ncbi:hypothetical protein L218DRAFT_612766 [Marasmius fiardii PR-910]|nr:hypothetical protein L218DRAFT_612766 [Marasmius fiardii PR-910]
MVHIPPHQRHRRQVNTVAPTGAGISGAKTVDGTFVGTGSTLAFDSSATPGTGGNDDGSKFTISTEKPISTSPPTSTPVSASSSPTPSSATSSSDIPIGTVIGACIGAFIGAIVIICIGVWFYRKADPKKKRRGPQRDAQGRAWNKLSEGEDTWEGKRRGMEMAQQPPRVAPDSADYQKDSMETMFKKTSPSIRTEYTIKTDFDHPPFNLNLDNHPFATYHPNLAKELANAPTEEDPRPHFMNIERAQSGHTWDGDAATAHESFLSLNSAKRVSGSMSPSLDMAIPTPPATSHGIHRWESAEVLNFEPQAAEIIQPPPPVAAPNDKTTHNPFLQRRKSEHNPFFGAHSFDNPTPSSRTPSTKGKQRELTPASKNPFADENMSHTKVDSLSSVTSNDRAIQSLLAALDATPGADSDPRHPSVQSAISAYSTADDVTGSFPLPPGAK